ncbi:hypothetical protein GF1_18690 [Desulfolithobacter dissulfuricans]|uniref:Glycosyltransferase n=1 Tax=Desulfolithobacter dissulfuricans TaxID=2795293 RepID=A0A915XKN9_9BACT|nr:hypothetical protein GF1_18690 [Desulfolithobacter dissulfuricans]
MLSHGNGLRFLRQELREHHVSFIELQDYPKLERGSGLAYFYYLVVDLFTTARLIRRERNFIRERQHQYACIISDGRYGICSTQIPSFLISHQISFIMPRGLGLFRPIVDWINSRYLRRFDMVFIPDFPEMETCLSGRLSHNRVTDKLKHNWIGVLSAYTREQDREEIDYLFIISGYLEHQRESFIGKLLEQAKRLAGTKVFVLGDTSTEEVTCLPDYNITIYPVVTGSQRNTLFNQARLIVSRSGYTTVMDLAEMDKQAVLFATPKQTEQEYLADFLGEKQWYVTGREQKHVDLPAMVEEIQQTDRFIPPWKTEKSLEIVHDEVKKHLGGNRFSLIIPAHNEEHYLEGTLNHLVSQDYPVDCYEIIVVENGSTDSTREIASSYAAIHENLSVLTCEKGVSRARNTGFAQASPDSDWIVFLDADTRLEPGFLRELDRYLGKHAADNLAIGTTALKPSDTSSAKARFWFSLYDLGHRLSRTSYGLQIVRAEVASQVAYDEQLSYAEDLDYIRQARRYGDFFFLQTDKAATSARRFEKQGYLKQTLIWWYQAMQPVSMKKGKSYLVIR